jgi:hypothetical protein
MILPLPSDQKVEVRVRRSSTTRSMSEVVDFYKQACPELRLVETARAVYLVPESTTPSDIPKRGERVIISKGKPGQVDVRVEAFQEAW